MALVQPFRHSEEKGLYEHPTYRRVMKRNAPEPYQ